MNRFGLFAVWVAATAVATLLAWQVVGAADDQISDAPTTPLIALTAPDTPTSTAVDSTVDTTTSDSGETSTSTTDATVPGATSTTQPNSTTSTTNPGSTTTATSAGVPATTTAVSDGGTVTVTGVEPNVELVAVVAVPGWSYQVTEDDGTRVDVTFRHTLGNEIRVRIEWNDGRLAADIDD